MLTWRRSNTLKNMLPNRPGIYRFYDKNRRLLYVGHANNLRHRVQSYREKDDYTVHPTKQILRGRIKYYTYDTMPLSKAEAAEKMIKKFTAYNYR